MVCRRCHSGQLDSHFFPYFCEVMQVILFMHNTRMMYRKHFHDNSTLIKTRTNQIYKWKWSCYGVIQSYFQSTKYDMSNKSPTPEEIMPDNCDHIVRGGTTIRKGTMAAAMTAADVIESSDATSAEKEDALQLITDLAPVLIKFGLSKHLTWNNPTIQNIFERTKTS